MAIKNLPDLFRTNSLFNSDWNPFQELNRMQRQIDRALDLTAPQWELSRDLAAVPAFAPTCDVRETDSHFLMSYDLPGVKKEDVKISLQDGVLTVSGERKEERHENERTEKGRGQYVGERFYGAFQRSFSVPNEVKAEQIETEFKDGVLRVAVPKIESSKAQQIKIGEAKPGFWDRMIGHKKEETKKAA